MTPTTNPSNGIQNPSMDFFSPYLVESDFCDHPHPSIRELSRELAAESEDPRDIAVKTFYWVRDNVTYCVGQISETASQTLQQRRGSCTNKANLFVALLRANGIPAGYRIMRVKTREYFGPTVTHRFHKFMSNDSFHIFAAVHLGEKWLSVDPSDDHALSLGTHHLNPQSKVIDFDGTDHAMLNLDPATILHLHNGSVPSVDEILAKKARLPQQIVRVFNLSIQHARENGQKYQDVHKLEQDFFAHLEKNHPEEYAFYCAAERALEANMPVRMEPVENRASFN